MASSYKESMKQCISYMMSNAQLIAWLELITSNL